MLTSCEQVLFDILGDGDLTRMHEVCSLVANAHAEDESTIIIFPSILVSDGHSLRILAKQSDSAFVRQLFFIILKLAQLALI